MSGLRVRGLDEARAGSGCRARRGPQLGFLGESCVNLLQLNRALETLGAQ